MRKIWIIIIAVFSLGFYLVHSAAAEKINLRLDDDEIGIVFINKSMLLVIDEDDEATLLVLDKDNITNLRKFSYDNLNVIMRKNTVLDVRSDNRLILDSSHEIDDVSYSVEKGLIYINYKDTNVCIYTGGEYNISNCQFVYFYNNKVPDLTVYDYNEAILYYYKKPLSNNVLEHIYEQSVDTYQIRDDELTIIKLGEEDYDFIVIANE